MAYRHQRTSSVYERAPRSNEFYFARLRVISLALLLSLTLAGCSGVTTQNTGNANTTAPQTINANANANANTGADTSAAPGTSNAPLTAREPQTYSVEMTVTAQATGNSGQVKSVPIQFNFVKNGTDRRWEFKALPGLGEITYIEKAGVKYLVFPAQKRYAELQGNEIGVPLSTLLTPTAAIEQLRSRGELVQVGSETVNERQATKYRLNRKADTQTQAGTAEAESIVYVDQETGLPLRADINLSNSRGQTIRIMTETRNIQLSPDLSLMNEPTGMAKVTQQELQQQIQVFMALLQAAAGALGQPIGM